MSISLRGMNRSKAAPLLAAGAGKASATSSSLGCSTLRPGAVQKSSTGTLRRPPGPAISQIAPSAISVGIESAAGELLQRFPPRLARLWIWMPPISDAESISAGNRRAICASR